MKVIPVQYQCEICGAKYNLERNALHCEAQVIPNYTIGLIFGDASDATNHHSHNLTFCVAEYSTDKHQNDSALWACRDNGAGDSLGTELCGGMGLHLVKHDAVKDFWQPTFQRMVAYLSTIDVTPLVWDGTKEVPYEGLV